MKIVKDLELISEEIYRAAEESDKAFWGIREYWISRNIMFLDEKTQNYEDVNLL